MTKKRKAGGASAKVGEGKQLDSNKVSKLFSGVLISDLVKDDTGEGVVLLKSNKTRLGVVAEETARKLGGTVSKAFGAPSMRYLLRTLGLCRVDLDLPLTDELLAEDTYTENVALRLATGSQTALWRIVKDYRFVCEMLARPPPNSPSRIAWANLTDAVFTVLEPPPVKEPIDQATPEEGDKKGKPLSDAEKKKRKNRLDRLKNLTALLEALPELMDKSEAQARREQGAGGTRPPHLAKEDTHWVVPDEDRALYALLLSTTLRRDHGGEGGLVPPDPTRELKWGIPPQAYFYMRRLAETLPPADQDEALEARAKAEQKLLEEHRNGLPEDPMEIAPVQAAQGGAAVAAPTAVPLAHAAAARSLTPDTPVVKYMLSNPHRLERLRAWEGVYGLLGVLSGGRLVYVRHYDRFESLSNDGDVPFSRLGHAIDLPQDFGGSCRFRSTGQRAGRIAVCSEVAKPFENTTPWERVGRRLVFDRTGTRLLGMLNAKGQVVQLQGLLETLHGPLQAELNTHQVIKAKLDDPGWLVDFHHAAAMPLVPTEDMANPGATLQLETGVGGGAAEGERGTKRTGEEAEIDGVIVCRNRLTSGDMASLVMVHYLWSGVVEAPQAPNLVASLSVVWELPEALLAGLLGDESLASDVYNCLLRPSDGSEVFFLQDLLTLFNGCGWAGRLKQDAERFIKTRWKPLLSPESGFPEDALLPLPVARAQTCTPPTGPLVYITMSSSEPMMLSLHYFGQGGDHEQHARIGYDAEAKALFIILPEDMQDMLRARGVDPRDLSEVVLSLRANQPATQALMREGATRTKKKARYQDSRTGNAGGH